MKSRRLQRSDFPDWGLCGFDSVPAEITTYQMLIGDERTIFAGARPFLVCAR